MAVNNAHAGRGVLIYAGECIILFCDHVSMEFSGSLPTEMKGTKTGRLYLTTHRVIFNTKDERDKLKSFAAPFFCLKGVELEQPVFGANYIKGNVNAQENGGFSGVAKFKLTFKHGGAIEFGQALLKVASMATRNVTPQWREAPPPYSPPQAQWTAAPPPAYAPPQAGYYGWAPPTNTFPDRPPPDGVFMYEAPPPYPGLAPQTGYPNAAPPQASYPATVASPPGYPAAVAPQGGYPGIGFAPQPPVQNGFPMNQGANQGAYYDPGNPQYAYVPPPPYSPTAPSYDDAKKMQ